ncbi:hypothetical protein F4821DRAFT_229090 [Hypoxylon rubiginosum]|uniref:Uncharacterized protein n=1 Tax=Hypoxylon rubiginosum TaxID=110542 RepID=A0ACC0DC51_9PEZI|nr:hypothetical protein F4821DRAFT_229090 [Hypoxylon rubiginosum]
MKHSLGNSDFENFFLTDTYTLHATDNHNNDYTLDLNICFANYLGTLDHVTNLKGGFGGSCPSCAMNGTILSCECSMGEGLGTKHNEFQLDDWKTIQVAPGGILSCSDMPGVEKRLDNKSARLFVA